jgi:peptide/nickel transport system ATP-binding protein/oligopeptide transport system ATP-binding protein
VTAGLLGVDNQGSPDARGTSTEVKLGPGYEDEWFDVKTRTMVKD